METADFMEEVKDKRLAVLGLTREDIQEKLDARAAARAAREWAAADGIRADLEGLGVVVMDRPGGVEWRVRLSAPE